MAEDRDNKLPENEKQDSHQADREDRHEKRPEGPYKDPADEQKQAEVK